MNLTAEVHLSKSEVEPALKAARAAAELYKDGWDQRGEASSLAAIAAALAQKGEKEEGLKTARQALHGFFKASDRRGEARARALVGTLRAKPEVKKAAEKAVAPPYNTTLPAANMVAGATAPVSIRQRPFLATKCIAGVGNTCNLGGQVCLVTGASRGIGKGISQELARAGAIVYVSGRSSPGAVTDQLLQGTVDETAAQLTRMGNTAVGVAVHVDHAHMPQNKAVGTLLGQHGRLDLLVNNAFYIPKPDLIFFGTPVWMQPSRFLNEQIACGGFNHVAESILYLPLLRRGKGLIVNISSWGSQINIGVFPLSYYVNKALFDRAMSTLGDEMRKYRVFSITLWPGSVKSERSILASRRTGTQLKDLETTRFSGRAVVLLAKLQDTELARVATYFRTVSSSDLHPHEIDGYLHAPDLHTFQNVGNAITPKPMSAW